MVGFRLSEYLQRKHLIDSPIQKAGIFDFSGAWNMLAASGIRSRSPRRRKQTLALSFWILALSLTQSLTTYSGVLQGLGGPYKMHQGEAVRPSTSTFGKEKIRTFSAKPVKSLGQWYHTFLNATEQVDQLRNDAVSGQKSVHKTSLPGTFKLWSMQCWLLSHHVTISLTVNLKSQR